VSDEKDTEDGSDWLSSQFDPKGAVPAQPAATPPPTPPPAAPPAPTPPAPTPTPPAPTPAPLPATPAPVAPAPTPNAGGGFNWGLKPGGTVDQPPVATPSAPVTAPPPLVNPPTTPHVAPPTQLYVPEPTKPLSWGEFAATQEGAPAATPQAPEQPTEAYTVLPWQPAAATSPSFPEQSSDEPADPTSAIDSLFGDHKFQEYEEVGVLKTIQVPPSAGVDDSVELSAPREPLPQAQKVLLGVAAGLLAALILVGLFFFGQHLGSAAAVQPKATNTASSTPTPAGTGGPATPGVQQWTALQGGECIQPFSSAWALTFTVVACTADHDAEMVFKGTLPDAADTKYPTATDFQKEITPLCTAPTAINYTAAVSVTDLQVSFSYPPTTAKWLSGDRTYYCFVDRVSGGNLPGDLSVPKTQ
jgi:Septum formation